MRVRFCRYSDTNCEMMPRMVRARMAPPDRTGFDCVGAIVVDGGTVRGRNRAEGTVEYHGRVVMFIEKRGRHGTCQERWERFIVFVVSSFRLQGIVVVRGVKYRKQWIGVVVYYFIILDPEVNGSSGMPAP